MTVDRSKLFISVFGVLFYFCLNAFAFDVAKLPAAVTDTNYVQHSDAKAKLGQLLFYDRVLSGTFRVSCATCHHHDRASSNGQNLPGAKVFEADSLAINGRSVYDAFKPSSRPAPALFNLGAKEFKTLFSDGRVAQLLDGTLLTPSGNDTPKKLDGALAAQALFPVVNLDELVGTVESEIKDAAENGHPAIWAALMKRVVDLEEYEPYFRAAYPELTDFKKARIHHVANAIGAFVALEWRSDKSPFDEYLRGKTLALSESQKRGMQLFYGKAQCSACHSGPFQTDHKFHGSGLPVWRHDEPFDGVEQELEPLQGREGVTGKKEQRYHFRTPSLRNVAVTAPYGWSGSHKTLPEFLHDHIDPSNVIVAFVAQGTDGFNPPERLVKVVDDVLKNKTMPDVHVSDGEREDLLAFLKALTDPQSLKGRLGKPKQVPSSLALD